jgi:hypothetical protein
MFIVLTALVAAQAATYSVELPIPKFHGMNGTIPPTGSEGYARALTQVSGQPDIAVASTDPRVTCEVKDGWVSVLFFAANSAAWPATFPLQATCTYGAETLNIDVVPMTAATDPSFQPSTLVNSTVSFTKRMGASYLRTYRLPADTWVPGGWKSSTLAGVKCKVVADHAVPTASNVAVVSAASAADGIGSCGLARTGKANWTLNLDLSSAQ